ncbi:hypothetical protein [Thioflexithrix psekupsensis]|uniref:Nudix hydrolase domain-containing protein n=1 Tax=Thioflexithrix psekupsensis TaxID=1570016 RepID=A0A251XBG7_9GAMM|nr:hypothetical protein [Thioflexithrix psekupsensis]OUD15643.1 hypothetical protein TPSD3_03745 [Thioflexithrix psekupsensis]
MLNQRVIIYHKQATSARTLFLCQNKTVCLPSGLPTLSGLLEDEMTPPEIDHALTEQLQHLAGRLNLQAHQLVIDEEFCAQVDAPDGAITVFLARCQDIDPPRSAVAAQGGQSIALTEARQLPPTELALLRLAYQVIMEG